MPFGSATSSDTFALVAEPACRCWYERTEVACVAVAVDVVEVLLFPSYLLLSTMLFLFFILHLQKEFGVYPIAILGR